MEEPTQLDRIEARLASLEGLLRPFVELLEVCEPLIRRYVNNPAAKLAARVKGR